MNTSRFIFWESVYKISILIYKTQQWISESFKTTFVLLKNITKSFFGQETTSQGVFHSHFLHPENCRFLYLSYWNRFLGFVSFLKPSVRKTKWFFFTLNSFGSISEWVNASEIFLSHTPSMNTFLKSKILLV